MHGVIEDSYFKQHSHNMENVLFYSTTKISVVFTENCNTHLLVLK